MLLLLLHFLSLVQLVLRILIRFVDLFVLRILAHFVLDVESRYLQWLSLP